MAEIRTPDVDDLLCVLAAIDDPDTIFALLEDLFTVREIRETSQRLGVARLLAAGKSYAAIEAETGASATTIARVSKCLSYGAGGGLGEPPLCRGSRTDRGISFSGSGLVEGAPASKREKKERKGERRRLISSFPFRWLQYRGGTIFGKTFGFAVTMA